MATITVGQNSYVTEAELQTYADDRGITIDAADPSVLLIQAMDYLETRSYRGEKTAEGQELEWPRTGITGLDEDTVPQKIKDAQMTLALIYDGGGDPLGQIGQRVTQETVEGAVSVRYSDKGNQSTLYPKLTALLQGLLAAGSGGGSFAVVRA